MMNATRSPKTNYFFPGIKDEVRGVKVLVNVFTAEARGIIEVSREALAIAREINLPTTNPLGS
jgi:hypothetical protein